MFLPPRSRSAAILVSAAFFAPVVCIPTALVFGVEVAVRLPLIGLEERGVDAEGVVLVKHFFGAGGQADRGIVHVHIVVLPREQ